MGTPVKVSPRNGNRSRTRDQRGPGGPRGAAAQQIRKKRTCRFCDNKENYIDYKNEKKIQRFISEQGRIIPKRITGTCARHQRMLVVAIKRARHLALLPFVSDAVK
ncbi:MAG: 30S ribosomal protein S18 [Ignavibacteriales bacterium]|nr:30S ribosomal protein S18 [Ignavibacteriales bacterium]